MIEVIWHGRGGQGAFTAARLLGAAASLAEGSHALAFPSFGPERRGAPMRAFTKMSDAPIGDRSAVSQADYVIYLDDTLLGDSWADELKQGGTVLVNSTRAFDDARVVALDADGISTSILGRPIPNTVFLGALTALCERVRIEDVQEAIRQYMPAKLHEKNLAVVDAAVETVLRHPVRAERAESAPVCHPERAEAGPACHPERVEPAESFGGSSAEEVRRLRSAAVHIPTLRSAELDSDEFAHSTCFEAGYLTVKNAGWRNMRPLIDASACTGCLQCYLYCPDGTVFKVEEPGSDQASVAIDYDFCKGCGICAKICAFDAIAMLPERDESEADAR